MVSCIGLPIDSSRKLSSAHGQEVDSLKLSMVEVFNQMLQIKALYVLFTYLFTFYIGLLNTCQPTAGFIHHQKPTIYGMVLGKCETK